MGDVLNMMSYARQFTIDKRLSLEHLLRLEMVGSGLDPNDKEDVLLFFEIRDLGDLDIR